MSVRSTFDAITAPSGRSNRNLLRLVALACVGISALLTAVVPAHATDRIIINGSGCQVTEEDAIGVTLHQDLYLRIDYPNTHWRGVLEPGRIAKNRAEVEIVAKSR